MSFNAIKYIFFFKSLSRIMAHYSLRSQVSGCILQTAQTWANAGVCSASCAHALGILFVYLSLFVCLLV